MRKMILLLSTVCLFGLYSAEIKIKDTGLTEYKLSSVSSYGFDMEFSLANIEYSNISTEKGEFVQIRFDRSKFSNTVGAPKLPVLRELVEFPASSIPKIEILSVVEKQLDLVDFGISNKIIPAQPSYSKSNPPSEIKFIINDSSYEVNRYSEENIANITKSGNMRGSDVGVLEIRPVSYNPVKNSAKVITDLKIRVSFTSVKSDPEMTKEAHYSPFFDNQFSKFINYIPSTSKADLTRYPVTYLIVANEILTSNAKLQEFIDWKTEKGFNVITQFFPSTATTATIDTWIENQYASLSPKPTFLLIIGDQAGTYVIPTEQNPPLGSAGSVSVSDLLYSVIGATSSTNRIPSIYVGRFSINNLTDLDAQINKTLWYEKYQFDTGLNPGQDFTYLSRVMGVSGVDASYAATYGNPQIRYGMSYYFNDNYRIPLDGSGVNITGIPYYYPASAGSSVDAAVVAEMSAGVAFYNYTAHGYNGGFADPAFTISNVDNLTNTGEYGLVVGNCCLTGSFRDTECFGESWLNAPNKGAVGFIGASMSTYWDEDLAMGIGEVVTGDITPAYTPDSFGMYDSVMRMRFPTQGAVRFSGLMAVEELGSSFTSAYWSSYHMFGDPSVMVYLGIPLDNSVSHNPVLVPGDTFFTVQAKKGSYVAITDDDGVLHGAAVADDFGYAVVTIDPFTNGYAHIAVTCQFKKPYFASVPVEALDGPYLLVNDYNLSTIKAAGSGNIDLELKNIGISTSQGISVSLSSENSFISFSDFSESYGSIAANDSLLKTDAFTYSISPAAPDGEKIRINLTINDTSKRTYYSYINFVAEAPTLEYSHFYEGEVINPGDTKDITFTINNTGSADLSSITATLSELSGGDVTISAPQSVPLIASGNSVDVTFTVNFDTSIPNGTGLDFSLDISAVNGFTDSYLLDIDVGMTEDYETGDFANNPWYFEGNADWTIDNTVFYSGLYSSKSGSITDSQSSSMKIDFVYVEDGTVSFYKKTSSESGYDKLYFYIDGVQMGNWSGDLGWGYHSYPVTAGIHTFTWMYSKDSSLGIGLDCAWVDNILATNAYSGIEEELTSVPEKPALYQNYPNPFNPVTTIKFSVPEAQNVKLRVFNSNGQMVKDLINNKVARGVHSVSFNAESLNSGIYFYTLEAPGNKFTRKMLLIK